jgi:hypothetical protein
MTNAELEKLIKGADIVRFIKAQRLKWLGHIVRMEQVRMVKKLAEWNPTGRRLKGRPKRRWMEDVLEDLLIMKTKNWKQKVVNREAWNKLVEKAKTHTGL